MNNSGTYKIENILNGKSYIGGSTDLKKREWRHFYDLKRGKHHSILLQREFDEFGIDNFKFEVIEYCENPKEKEKVLLDNLDWEKSYNISKESICGNVIHNHPNRTEIVLKAIKNLLACKKQEPRFGKDNPNWKGGRKTCICGKPIEKSAKFCIKCVDRTGENNSFFNKKHSDETKKKISEKKKRIGYIGNQEKEVLINNITYKSVSEAARALKVAPNTIINRIRNKKFLDYSYK